MKNLWKIGMLSGIFSLGMNGAFAAALYYHPDHLGSATVMTNEHSEIAEAILYAPFGEVLHKSVPEETASVPFLYTGQELDAASELFYYNARYYDPVLARFVSVDPAERSPGEPQSLSSYAYTLNNPVGYVDPDGEEPKSYQNLYEAFIDQYSQSGNWGEPFKVPPLFGDHPVKWASFPTDIKLDKEGGAHFTLHPVDPETGAEFFTTDSQTRIQHRYALEIMLPSPRSRSEGKRTSGNVAVEGLASAYRTLRMFSSILDEGYGFAQFELDSGKWVELNLRTGIYTPVGSNFRFDVSGQEVKKVVFGVRWIGEEGRGEGPSQDELILSIPMYERELPLPSPSVIDLLTALWQESK